MTTVNDLSAQAGKQHSAPQAQWFIEGIGNNELSDPFALTGEHFVGRRGCEITLHDPHSSRQHAKITFINDELRIEDLNSANGTFINGEEINSAQLKHGDLVRFDQQEFMITGPEDSAKTILRPAEPKTKKSARAHSPQHAVHPSATEEASTTLPKPVKPVAPNPGSHDGSFDDQVKNSPRQSNSNELRDLIVESKLKRRNARSGQASAPSLVVMTGEAMGKSIALDNDTMTIGRIGVDIPFDETSISTKHAQLSKHEGKWKVVDLMSANGVYVNGKKTQSAFLIPGDIIRIGRVELRFTSPGPKPRPAKLFEAAAANPALNQAIGNNAPNTESTLPSWLYVALGFGIALAVGAYLMSSF